MIDRDMRAVQVKRAEPKPAKKEAPPLLPPPRCEAQRPAAPAATAAAPAGAAPAEQNSDNSDGFNIPTADAIR